MNKAVWIRADASDDAKVRKDMIVTALECGISTAIVRPEDSALASVGKVDLLFNEEGALSDGSVMVRLSSPEDQDAAMAMAGKVPAVILERSSDWTIIPLENMIAKFRGSGTKVMACAADIGAAEVFLKTLETGVDGIVVDVKTPNDVRVFADMTGTADHVDLEELKITDVRPIEMGDRVCVDTVSVMVPGEGMLIGSQAACLFLVQSESEENGYVAARPFRVNAGAVHAYIQGPEGRTRYLSELRSGDPVVLVDRNGNTRASAVGRCKIEKRPMIIVEAADARGVSHTTILQNAETVKMVGPSGSISVSKLKAGDAVLARIEEGGRHFGMKIDETMKEI
jgi:3-dehydroquinate synthase II